MARDRWHELCERYKADDGLPTRKAGPWTADKLYFWYRYLDITTTAMVGHRKWPTGLVYVDLFAGPGICEIEESGQRIPGSTLIAANTPKPFRSILVSELDPECASALEARLKASPAKDTARVFVGDCNDRVADIARQIPDKALTLAFIDPENLRVDFATVRTLAQRGAVDLLILFADRMDIVRNVETYERQQNSVLDRMLGPSSTWRDQWAKLDNRQVTNVCRLFADEYQAQLKRHLGYKVFGEQEITSARGPLYRLIYASKSDRGLDFWNKVVQKDRGGQMGFPF